MQLDPLGAVAAWAAVWSYAGRRGAGVCPLSRGWRVSLFAPGARDQNAANLAGTTGGGCNLFCGEVHRLPLGLCRPPGGAAAIVWRWVRVVVIVAGVVLCCYP